MRNSSMAKIILLLCAGLLLIGAGPGPGNYTVSNPEECNSVTTENPCSEITVTGHSKGNHELDCTVIQPWPVGDNPIDNLPVIVWANGWGWNNNAGETTTDGYKPGLIEWAFDGPYIVVAANQWSVQESDVLQCLEWVIDEYSVPVNPQKIGLAGHSQGGGAIIKAGDGQPNGFNITATIAMNPYGPAWVRPWKQDGQMMILGGDDDTTTPTDSFIEVWKAVKSKGPGGLFAELQGGTHNDDAWAPAADYDNPHLYNFGRYQEVTRLWWRYQLKGEGSALIDLGLLLDDEDDEDDWEWEYAD